MTLTSRPFSRAFSLVEVTLALGIIAFCLVALFGLLPVGVNSNQTTVMQTSAASAAASVVADLRATPRATTAVPAPVSPLLALPIPNSGDPTINRTVFLREDGSIAAASGTNVDKAADAAQTPIFRATISFYPPSKDKNQRTATTARVVISWPALADPDPSKLPSKYTGTFETTVALDRN